MRNRVKICKWKYGAISPVVMGIDDLANVWVDRNKNGKIEPEEDWGYAKNRKNSAFYYLINKLLKPFPDVKVTFFVPVGIRSGLVNNSDIPMISKMLNSDAATIDFFRNIHNNPRFEIAYHGTDHGIAGKERYDYIQEWQTFTSLQEAKDRISYGKEIMKEVIGEYPKGGKYPGYASNEFSDQSIEESGFEWWSRYANFHKNRALKKNVYNRYIHGPIESKSDNYSIKKFGKNSIYDIPTTLQGNLFNPIILKKKNFKSKVIKLLKTHYENRFYKEIDYLLNNNKIINIFEHMSPSRNHISLQEPNIFTDNKSLTKILYYLEKKHVWNATISEIYMYKNISEKMILNQKNNKFHFDNIPYNADEISLQIENSEIVITPDNRRYSSKGNVFTLPILRGMYRIC